MSNGAPVDVDRPNMGEKTYTITLEVTVQAVSMDEADAVAQDMLGHAITAHRAAGATLGIEEVEDEDEEDPRV